LDLMGVDRFLARLEAIDTPHYRECRPASDLDDVLACRWVRVVRGGPRGPSAIIPDGCADVMVYDDAPPHVAGPDATTRWTTLHEGTVITGIRLRPGAVRTILGCDARAIVNGGALLSDLAPGAARLHLRLLTAERLSQRHALLEDWVRRALAPAASGDRAVIAACRLIAADPRIAPGTIARQFTWTARTMHRQFRAACGYGPKHLQRIMRIQAAIRAAHDAAPVRLADVAAAAGYADQAHMSRDFRDITGFSPREHLTIARPEVGAWLRAGW
jgi:AraC-like DNA-binding protein